MGMNKTLPGYYPLSHDRPLLEQHIDAYKMKGKLAEPTACHRINDNFPAGYVTLEGPFYAEHHDEILRTVNNLERREREEHALKRIIKTEKKDNSILITTTDIHLARGIGKAVHDAYKGELSLHYNAGENRLRAYWKR